MTEYDSINIVSAFTEDQVERLTGISKRQLRYWDRNEFFIPSLAYENRRRAYSRLYTFRDIVSLKVLNALRNDAGVSLHHLREVKRKLAHLGEDLWSKTTLYVLNKEVVFDNPETSRREAIVSGQGILRIPLKIVTGDMKRAVDQLKTRSPDTIGKIESHRGIAQNKPVISGTRIMVDSIKSFYEAGYSINQIMQQYPLLTREDIAAAISHEKVA